MFDVLFTLDRSIGRVIDFEINEPVYPVPSRMSLCEAIPMLVHPSDEVVRHADIKCATGTAREDVQTELVHGAIPSRKFSTLSIDQLHDVPLLSRSRLNGKPCQLNRDGRDKPGHDHPI
jgi:hypothetical protein